LLKFGVEWLKGILFKQADPYEQTHSK
jgi:hypothetical protein